jgi:sortase A
LIPARSLFGALLATAGTAVAADAAVTVVWQEPVTALKASLAQDDLGTRYADVRAKFAELPLPAPAAVPRSRAVFAQTAARETMLARARAARRLDEASKPGAPIGRLRIPRIGLSTVWVQSTTADALRDAPGHYAGTPLPGRRGTVAIAGHRTTYGAPFRKLDQLDRGDRIEVSMPYGGYGYVVERTRIVSPKEASVLRAARSDRLVLTACHPLWSAKQRIVVTARLVRWPGMLRTRPPATRAAEARRLAQARATLKGAPPLTTMPRTAASRST